MMCLENVVIGLASDVCRSCRWKFTVVHSAGVLIKVIHQSAPSSPSIFWTLLNSMLIPWSKLLHKHLKKCPPVSWQNWCEAISATEGNEEHVMWEDSITRETLGLEINGVLKPALMPLVLPFRGEEGPLRKHEDHELTLPTSALSERHLACIRLLLLCNKLPQT